MALSLPPASAAPTQQAYLKASRMGSFSYGRDVAISGDTIVVGAEGESSSATGVNGNQNSTSASSSGAGYVFVRSGTNWSQQAYLKASNTGIRDYFGHSVSVSGDTIVVGAMTEDSTATGVNGTGIDPLDFYDAGAAYLFARSGTNWSQQAYLKASNTGEGDFFGWSVAVSGNTVVVGALGEDSISTGVNGNQANNSAASAGAAYVFVRDGTNWTQQAYLKPSNTGAGDNFGNAVAISGDTIVVGAAWEDSNTTGVNGNQNDNSATNAGAAYVFVRNGTNWTQQGYLKASNSGPGDNFGYDVAISGDTVVVGAYAEASNAKGVDGSQSDNSLPSAGAAYVFARSGTNWSQQAYLKASNTDQFDSFGHAVAVSGDTVVVGADFEDSNAIGINGNETNNAALSAGAVYYFIRTGTNWIQRAYIKASNAESGDNFGVSVAVSGDSAAISAITEDSNATGVNGDQANNSMPGAGAVYVFTGMRAGPKLALVPDGSGGHFIRFSGTPDVTYRLERASAVNGPWDTVATLTAPASGLVEFHSANTPPGPGFYRSVQP